MNSNLNSSWKPDTKIHRKWFGEGSTLAQIHYVTEGSKLTVKDFKIHTVVDHALSHNRVAEILEHYPDSHAELLSQTFHELHLYLKNEDKLT